MTDIRTRLIDALAQHSRRTDPNHPSWPKCRCGFDPEAPTEGDTWAEHVADRLLSLPGIAIIESDALVALHDLGTDIHSAVEKLWDAAEADR